MPPIDDEPQTLTDLAGLLAGSNEDDNEGDTPETDQTPADPPKGGDDGNLDGTDAAEPEEAGADGDDEGEGDGVSTEPVYTVKIDGKDHQVNLKEALAGYQRQADYTRKAQEVAAARQAAEAEMVGARQQREQYANVLKVILDRLGPEEGELNAEQWNVLRQTDPNRYAAEWADYQRRQTQREAVKAEQHRVQETKKGELLQVARQHLDGERQKLVAALPEFGDAAKAPQKMKAIREYAAKNFGYSEGEMDQAYDHRMIIAMNKAMQWDSHMASLAAAKAKVKGAPQLPTPGARQPQKAAKTVAREAQQKKFDKSGRVEDAVGLLIA